MSKFSPKSELSSFAFQDFSGGMNTQIAPELIAENEAVLLENIEFSESLTAPNTVDGLLNIVNFPPGMDEIDGIYRVHFGGASHLLFWVGTTLWRVEGGGTHTKLGDMYGSKPTFCWYDNLLLIASGGKLQKYDGSKLEDSGAKHNVGGTEKDLECNIILQWHNRLCAAQTGQDVVYFSAFGSVTDWKHEDSKPDSGQYIYVGYKDMTQISGMTMLSSDLVVFKRNNVEKRIYRLVGNEFPDVGLEEVARDRAPYSQTAMCVAGNQIWMLDEVGFSSLKTVIAYGSMQTAQESYKIYEQMRRDTDENTQVLFCGYKNQIMILGKTTTWLYHLSNGAWTCRRDVKFNYCFYDNKEQAVYVAAKSGSFAAIYMMTREANDAGIVSTVISRKVLRQRDMLLRFMRHCVKNGALCKVYINNIPVADISAKSNTALFKNKDGLYKNKMGLVSEGTQDDTTKLLLRCESFVVKVVFSSRYSLDYIVILVSEVGI